MARLMMMQMEILELERIRREVKSMCTGIAAKIQSHRAFRVALFRPRGCAIEAAMRQESEPIMAKASMGVPQRKRTMKIVTKMLVE